MKDTPFVSILMATYNHGKYVSEAIESVLNQTYENFEFIITNDGSNDDTEEQIAKFEDKRIIYLSLDKNQGEYAALYNSYKLAKGKYIAIINSDDCWNSVKLTKQIKFLENNLNYSASFTWATFTGKKTDDHIFCQKNKKREKQIDCLYQLAILL